MAADKKKQLLFGGIGVVALVAVAVFLMRSGDSGGASQTRQPNQPVVRDTDSDFDDESAEAATRSAPTGDRSRGGRLAGASDDGSAVEEDDEESKVAAKTNRRKRRARKTQTDEKSDDEEETKKSGKQKVVPRPF